MASCPGSVILDVSDITQRHIGVTIVILVRDEAFMGAKKEEEKSGDSENSVLASHSSVDWRVLRGKW